MGHWISSSIDQMIIDLISGAFHGSIQFSLKNYVIHTVRVYTMDFLYYYIIVVMQESTLEGKQQYLREKIIDAGHDPDQFVEFCSKKHNLDDLQNWSLNELIEIVQAFLDHINPQPHLHPPSIKHNPSDHLYPSIAVPESTQVENSIPNKMGLVLTEDDWSILLSTPSIGNTKTDKKEEKQPESGLLNFDLSFPLIEPPQLKEGLSSKDSPLSPPSTEHKQPIQPNAGGTGPQKNELDQQLQKLNQIPLKEQPKIDKRGNESNSVINLSNIVITTAKEKTLIPLPNISDVTVSKTEQITRNFLQGDYTLYYITFSPCQLTIQRKFTDLIKLRGILRRLYPFLRLPYLESEGWLSSSEGKDPETLAKYKWMVEEFIRYITVKSQELRNSEVVRFFCGLTKKQYTKDEFRKKLQAYENVPRPKFAEEVVLTNNSIIIPPTPPVDKFALNTVTLISEIDVQYERLRRQLDYLFANYDLLLKSYSDVSTTFSTIQSLLNRYGAENDGSKEFKAFAGLQEMVVRMSVKISMDSEMFRSRIRNLFRFEKENMTTLRQIIDACSSIHHEFGRQGSPPLSTNKINKGGNMEIQSPVPLQDPIKNNKAILAVQEIFWSFAVRRETSRYWQLLRKKINEGLTLIAYDELDRQNETLNFWNGMIKRCVL